MIKKNSAEKKSSPFKDFFTELLKKSGEVLSSLIKNFKVPEWIQDIAHIKSIIRKYAIVMILSITALTLLMLGIASYLASQIPALRNGFGEILIGLILGIITVIYYKWG